MEPLGSFWQFFSSSYLKYFPSSGLEAPMLVRMFAVLAQVTVRNHQQWHQSINIKQHFCGCMNLLLVKSDSLIAVETKILS